MTSEFKQTILCEGKYKTFPAIKELTDIFKNVVWLDKNFLKDDTQIKEIEGFFGSSTSLHFIDDRFLHKLPNLKVVSICSAGIDGLEASRNKLHELNIRVANVPHLVADPTADVALMLMLATARRLKQNSLTLQNPDYEVRLSGISKNLGTDMTGATLGIIGMGGIGFCIAKRAKSFRMNILYHNRNRRSELDEKSVGAKYCNNLQELLKSSDFVVISVPLTPATTKLIGREELELMKPTSILINVARGRVVNTDALVDALNKKSILAAGLDVTDPEPLPYDHPLIKLDNVILSGHCGTATVKVRANMFKQTVENLKAGLTSGPMNNELFPPS